MIEANEVKENALTVNIDPLFSDIMTLKNVVIQSFDEEYARCHKAYDVNHIHDFFIATYFNRRFYSFFVKRNLFDLAAIISTNAAIRDLVLNLTDRVMFFYSSPQAQEKLRTICVGLAKSVVGDKNNGSNLIDEKVRQQISVDEVEVEENLIFNRWLLCLYVLYAFFSETSVFDTLVRSHSGEEKK